MPEIETDRSELARRLAQSRRQPRRMLRHTCLVCGQTFESPRASRMYCSGACKQRAVYQRRRQQLAGQQPSARQGSPLAPRPREQRE
jgi:predicted nucleic acid-binding Zn ribbon protein